MSLIPQTSRAILASLAMATMASATSPEPGPSRYDRFFNRVRPLLESRCISCHGPDKQEGGLRLDSTSGLLEGGDGGPAIVAGDTVSSRLLRAVRHESGVSKMPPKERLKEEQVADLAEWVRDGAAWPTSAQVLIEDDPAIIQALIEGDGSARLDRQDRTSGAASLIVDGQKSAAKIGAWAFPIRQHPQAGEYRFLRFAWKKRGGGGLMIEAARDGHWRSQEQTNASWVAGENTTGWPAIIVSDQAPAEWAIVTRDLWQDGGDWGDWSLTGLGATAINGGEVRLDAVILGPTIESLDAYAPGRGLPGFTPSATTTRRIGDAWTDPENPIRQIFQGERLDLWSLRKPVKPLVPEIANTTWARNPVDRFLLARMERAGLEPSPEADRRTLIRRVTFDLIGLPPSPAEIESFVDDPASDAYEKLVDRLLASPRHGERWARPWLDVVRYSDTNGFERDEFRPAMHRYRDYVIRSLNADKPYDRFVREQLAGDEIDGGRVVKGEEDVDRLVATGYLRLGSFDSTRSIFMEDAKGQDELMADLANTTGSAFLGMTMACCQCHDHKYEPLSQDDHYRFRAFFAAVKPVDDLITDLPLERGAIDRHNADLDRKATEVESRIKALLAPTREAVVDGRKAGFPEEIRKLLATDPKSRDDAAKGKLKPFREMLTKVERKEIVANLPAADKAAYEGLAKQVGEIKGGEKSHATAVAMTDSGKTAPAMRVFAGGDFTRPAKEVPPGFPSILDPNPAIVNESLADTTGRRLALAAWITSRDNPLTARVVVNRLWQGHFGAGLVATPNDLGYSGARPTHPELLDWLAVEFMDRGWSLKVIHRLLVTSATYRQASTSDSGRSKLDPDNALLWRQNVRRLDAEGLRDAILAVSGRLVPDSSGPPRWPPVPEEILEAQPAILEFRHGGADGRLQDWYGQPAEATDVRSVFLVQKRSVPILFLQPFDLPDMTISCARRTVTTVAPQALALLNSPDMARWSTAFADRVAQLAGDDPARQADLAFRLALLRPPSEEELTPSVDLLRRHAELYRVRSAPGQPSPDRRALADLCRALFNVNEFAYLD